MCTSNSQDQNDVIPQFPQISYNETILEDVPTGSTVIQLGAIDTDADGNGRLQYTITSQAGGDGSASFTIEADSGVVTTVGTFDRESFAGPYSIIVSVAFQVFNLDEKQLLSTLLLGIG